MRRNKRPVGILFICICIIAIGALLWNFFTPKPSNAPLTFPLSEFPPAESLRQEHHAEEAKQSDSTMRAVWISYLEFENILMGKNETSFRDSVRQMFQTCVDQNLNTAVIQVRSHGDSYYPSKYYPWSAYASGTAGEDPGFDPFQILLEEAKNKNLSVQAWLNPYRLMTEQHMNQISDQYLIRQWYDKDIHMKKQDGYYYLNPGSKEVQKLICDGASEIIKNYDVDGIQIDDYFYVIPPDVFGDTEQQARKNTTALVERLAKTVDDSKKDLVFGISPAGNFKERPCSDDDQYTDLTSWCKKGLIDYVAPQIYWDFDDDVAPFTTILTRWEKLLNGSTIDLYVGLANYKFDQKAIQAQMNAVLASKVAKGYLLFRYDYLTS